MRRLPTLLFCALLPLAAPAADAPQRARGTDAVPAPPPMRAPAADAGGAPETGLEPEVTIVTRGTEIHEEHRVNGRLYMVKVTPAKGRPYYLIDTEGSGQFRRTDHEPEIAIPHWVIKRF